MAFLHYTSRNMRRPMPAAPLGIVGAESLMGCTIVDRDGHHIGELRDIVLELSTGRIAYAVIALATPADGEALIIAPWNAVHANPTGAGLRINADADWIKRAPLVRQGLSPERFVQEWGAFIHNYFGTRPHWEVPPTSRYA